MGDTGGPRVQGKLQPGAASWQDCVWFLLSSVPSSTSLERSRCFPSFIFPKSQSTFCWMPENLESNLLFHFGISSQK